MRPGESSGLSGTDGVDARGAGLVACCALAAKVETVERIRESLLRQRRDLVVTCLVEELFDLLLADGEATETELHTLHRQREQHEQHWEEDHSETLHTGQ